MPLTDIVGDEPWSDPEFLTVEAVRDMTAVITAERERHRNLGPEQMVFNIRCTCGHIGQQVSVKNEFEYHVDGAIAVAISKHLEKG